jgi:hypothetical protein
MTRTERMKLAIQQKQVAAKIEAAPVKPPPIKNVDAQTDGAADMAAQWAAEQNAAAKQPKPAKAKKPKPDRYETQPEKFDTALQLHDRERLPDGAGFNMIWKDGEWLGALIVPGPIAEPMMFQLTGRKLFRLLADIDKLYREWKAKNAEAKS